MAAMRSHAWVLMRAIGTRNFIATCVPTSPRRTCSCTESGRASTSAMRRETQLVLRSKRRARSSRSYPNRLSSSASNQPCSSAVSWSDRRSDWSRTRASASLSCQIVTRTVSWPSSFSAAMRLKPSITRYRSGSPGIATTTIGTCCPDAASDASSLRCRSGHRTRRCSLHKSSWWYSRSIAPLRRAARLTCAVAASVRQPYAGRPKLVDMSGLSLVGLGNLLRLLMDRGV